MKYTNKSNGPKAIHTTDRGVVVLQPGQVDDLNVADGDHKALTSAGLLDAADGGGAPSLAAMQAEIASGATPAAMAAPAAEADTDKKSGKRDEA